MEAPREPPVVLESKTLESREEFDSRRLTEEKIIAALNDDSTITIGITGARGVGKTRLARRIAEMVKRDKVFKVVMMVRVGRSSNLERIADEISEYLGVSFQGRDFFAVANELLSKLILQERVRVLIILDDVRDFVDLQRIGIPLEKRNGLYKIMITSRFRKVCLAMRCNVIFEVQALTEKDILILSSERSGNPPATLAQNYSGSCWRFGNCSGSFGSHSPARFDANETKMLPYASTISGRNFEEPIGMFPHVLSLYISEINFNQPIRMFPMGIFSHLSTLTLEFSPYIGDVLGSLPSMKVLTLYNCPKEFSGGKLNTQCVTKDSSTHNIDEGNYSLFNEKPLYVHHSPLLGKYSFQEVEEITEGDDMTEPIPSHLQKSSRASGDSDFDAKNVHLISRQNTMKEENVAESCSHDLGEKREEGASDFCFETKDGREIEEMDDKMKSEVYIETLLNNKTDLKDFILFCSVFPLNYEFTKDILVWQWIAVGLIDLGEDEKTEEVCRECFDTLVGMHYIVPSGYDYSFDQMKYKIGDKMTTFFQSQLLEPKFGKYMEYMDSEQSDPTKVEFLSMTLKEFNHVKSGVLELYSRLLTLVIYDWYEVDRLPSNLFLELKTLKTLNLSRTNIVYLPNSVGNLKELRFFDMSKTRIVGLPQSICDVSHLQTLRLDGCPQLRDFPKDISKLINLRHLIIDVVRQLLYMPVGIGKLTNLRTLTAFLVDERDGCNVRELKDMNKLRGSFYLWNLQHVKTKEDASEACLSKKVHLRKIDLQWSVVREEKAPHEEEILESLQPPLGIQELRILFYGGGVFPSWICNPSFTIVSMFLYECRYCASLPSLGELPSLKDLSIIENEEVVEIDSSFCRKKRNQYHAAFPKVFWRKKRNQYHAAFPKLEKLTFESMSRLEKWTGLEKGDFPSLRRLIIEYCPEFVQLPNLEHLESLSQLEIRYCPKLSLLPRDKLPPSLQSLMINESPRLKEWCCDRDSSKIARVPTVYFDNHNYPPDQM